MNKQKRTDTSVGALMNLLASTDGMVRQRARKSLVGLGRAAVPSLTQALQTARIEQVRWEAAKALGAIGDDRSIPALVRALEDTDGDVNWVAAEALRKFRKAAWSPILRGLIRSVPCPVLLCQGAHHVLLHQKQKGASDSLATLMKSLESGEVTGSATVAAHEILKRVQATA